MPIGKGRSMTNCRKKLVVHREENFGMVEPFFLQNLGGSPISCAKIMNPATSSYAKVLIAYLFEGIWEHFHATAYLNSLPFAFSFGGLRHTAFRGQRLGRSRGDWT